MFRIKLSSNFSLDEFVAPEIYRRFQGNSVWFLNPALILIAQSLRDRFGPIVINNWCKGGKYDAETFINLEESEKQYFYTESGLRCHCSTTGAEFSQHKFGNAIDLKFKNVTPEQVRKHIIENYGSIYRSIGVSAIEAKTDSWLHIDCRNKNHDQLIIFNQ